jgi:pyoverdine/dityrosine biosynthesis protein Dit1
MVPKAPTEITAIQLAREILLKVMRFRRIQDPKKSCATSPCEACLAPHLPRVIAAIQEQRVITFVLPAFPGKSPNLAKVLGTLPDRAEQLALLFLNGLGEQIREMYAPGAVIILCSDGRVFNDIIGIHDTDVTDYQLALSLIIKDMPFIATFNLDDMYSGLTFNQMRDHVMAQYGEPLDVLKDDIRRGSKMPRSIANEEVHRQYCGITRFLVEDATHPEQTLSRNAIQTISRARAYVVIQRSRAWSEAITERFPQAVRLSIHPQTCGTPKLGIRLMQAESWMTPWHGVAVDIGGHFILLKRAQAEDLGARLVYQDDRPSHYELSDKNKLPQLSEVLHGM